MVLVRDIMSTRIIYGDPNDSFLTIVGKMARNNVGCIVIMSDGMVKGIVTERDIVHLLDQTNTLNAVAADVMSTPVLTTRESYDAIVAANQMVEKNVKKLVVMDGLDVKGIITHTDIIKNLERIAIIRR